MPLLTIARLTLREAARRRLLLAVAILTVLVIGLTGWGFSKLATLTDKSGRPFPHIDTVLNEAVFTLLVAYMFSFVLAVSAAFLAAPAIGADVESGLVLAMLPRPIRRSDFVLGKWLGLSTLLVLYTLCSCGCELLVIRAVTGYAPPHPVVAIFFLAGQGLVLLTLSLLASTRLAPMTCGIVAVILFGLAWFSGIVQTLGAAFNNAAITNSTTVISLLLPTDGLWRGAAYYLEPTAIVAMGSDLSRTTPFATLAPPTTPYLIWAVAWVLAILGLATWRFSRRDL